MYFRQQREAWIRAKYITKSFVRRLPFGEEGSSGVSAGNTEKQKRWSVQKRRRRSPSKQVAVSGTSDSTPSPREENKLIQGEHFLKKMFVVAMSPFCGATGTLCFGLRLTLPMGFKARVDAPMPVLDIACT